MTAVLVAALLSTTGGVPAQAAPAPVPRSVAGFSDQLRHGPDSHSVARLYHAYFLRAPDADGLAYWQAQAARGVSASRISSLFGESAEFRAKYGNVDNVGFVTLIYRNVLDRDPDPAGFAHWVNVLAERRLSRGGVMIAFSDSPEFKTKTGLFDPPGAPIPPVAPADSYSLYLDEFGRPIRWNPCAPIDVVINVSQTPHIRPIVVHALVAMTEATGVQWRLLGDTTEQVMVPGAGQISDRDNRDLVSRYGQRWAPILLTVPEVYNDRSTAGMASPLVVGNRHQQWVSVSGIAVLNRHFITGPGTTNDEIYHLVIHELAHVFGLDHTDIRGEVMYSGNTWPTQWGPGDRAGFRALTQGGCVEVPPLFAAWQGSRLLPAR